MADSQTETLSFEAEVKQLLHLVTHALYSNKEIFLRELISNASDAADRLRYEALSDSALYENDSELKIIIDVNKDLKTITIRDNGIGMSREEVIENLGTIAKSGTKAFKELLENKGDSHLIGQFGVGFYSAFIVADRVTVKTRRAGMRQDQGVLWESDGQGEYKIRLIDKLSRGTEVILHMKDDATEFLENYRIENIVTKYSDHILLPILMKKELPKSDEKEEIKEKAKEENYEKINKASALWTLNKNDIKDEDYKALYKHIAHDFEDPLVWSHNRVEGKLEYTSLLYIPARAPFDLWNRELQKGIKLYIKRVYIMDNPEFMPSYLRFVRGIIDSNDLPLNISREILQSNKIIEKIKAACVKRILSMLEEMVEKDKAQYAKFWQQFGEVLKEGPGEDYTNKERIAKLLRFSSTKQGAEEMVSLEEYVKRMPEKQDKIYYLIADTLTAAEHSPLLEVFKKKDIEVLLLHNRVDEWLMSHLTQFDGKNFQSIAKGKIDDLEKIETPAAEKAEEKQEKLAEKDIEKNLERFKSALKDQVKDIRSSQRLVNSPSCVVFDENDMSGHLQRLLAATGQAVPQAKPILELNFAHPLLDKVVQVEHEGIFKDWAEVLLNQALLAEGSALKDPAQFVKVMNQLLLG